MTEDLNICVTYTPKILTEPETEDLIAKHPDAKILYKNDDSASFESLDLGQLMYRVQCYCVELVKESDEELIFYGYDITKLW